MPPTILITRPSGVAEGFADQLRNLIGCDAKVIFSPVLRIEQTRQMPDLAPYQTLIFTSRNGVDALTATSIQRDMLCYCVGDATTAAAQEAGLTALSASGTVDDLAKRILHDNPSSPCLHIRGEHTAGNLAKRLTYAGLPTSDVIAYRQVAQPLSQAALAALNCKTPVILPLFSPRSARLVFDGGQFAAPILVAAISQAVADDVPEDAIHTIRIAEAPQADQVALAVQALLAQAKSLEGGQGRQ